MKSIEEFLSYLCTLDIKISVEGDRLRCNAPQGKLTLDLQTQLAQRKAEILAFLNQGNPAEHRHLEPIRAIARDGAIPLSFAQQRLWFLDQLEGEKSTYNIPTVWHLIGSLQVSTLEVAVQEIVRRHEALRTNFEMLNGSPIQIIHSNQKVNIPIVDLQGLTEVEQAAQVRQLVTQEAGRRFNLAHDPLLRVTLLRLSENSHVLMLVMHHIVSDGWSMAVFIRELSALYQSFSKGMPSLRSRSVSQTDATRSLLPQRGTPLAELPIQYADFTIWQRQWLQGEVLETQLNYWKQQLADAPPLLELPTDRPRPPIQTFRGGTQSFQLDRNLTQKLKRLSQQSGTTLFMTLLAAFVTLLSRYSNQSDIIVGSPIANRNRNEIESLIGFFINTLVLRIQCAGNPSFEQLLQRVQQVALDAYMHQDVPFEQLVEVLQPERSLSYNPLFQVMFILQNVPPEKLELPGLILTPLEIENFPTKFDLTLSIKETEQELEGKCHYNSDLFDATTIDRMVGHFQTILAGIVTDPQQRVSELPILTKAELHQLGEWNSTQVNYPQNKCIHELFEEQVELTPNAVALVFEDQQLTYRELNTRANQLAHHLQANNVKSEVLVGLCVERSLEMVVGLIGILKAGAAYVPLDPRLPPERLSFMLRDSGVEVLLTQQELLSSLPPHTALVICLDTDWGRIEQQCQDNLNPEVKSDNLAYVIYTSGSTGQPKGVMNTHQGLHNRLLWMQQSYQLTSSDRVVQKTPFSFDVSVWEFFWPLLTGARIVLAVPEGHKDTTYLVNLISQQQITTIHFVPSMLQVFLQEPNLGNCSCLKRVFCSGEALPSELIQRFFSKLECELHNLYGPTEAAIDVTFWQCQPQENLQIVPIGQPISNIQIYILDRHLQPVPIGIPGELHIGGDGLARGYLNRPELTQEKFIQNPFFDGKSERLYKTGDLARYLTDGNIEYLGRIDHQVKIRGFRIELGEIEVVINSYPQIQQAVVIAREDIPGNKSLVAYVVPSDQTLTTSQLREFLRQKLPEYMVPSAFVILDTLPLTHNGKIDRPALPIPDQTRPELESEFVAPYTPEQELLAGIWADVLDLKQVGIYDNFFDLGGDSIRSIQVLAKAKQLGLNFSLSQIFQYQTIYQLSRLVRDELSSFSTPKTEAFSLICEGDRTHLPSDIEDAYPLTALQAGMIFHSEYNPESSIYHDVSSRHVRVTFNEQILQTSLQDLAERHPILRTSFDLSNFREMLQLVHKTVCIPLEVEDLRHLSTTEQEIVFNTWFEAEKAKHFDWTCPPLLRFHVHRYTDETFQLTLSFHHAIFDGWSLASFRTELWQRYLSLLNQEALTLEPPPTIPFRDFVALERLTLESQECRQYWVEKLSDINITKIPRWPEAYRSPQVEQSGEMEMSISPEVSDGLKQLARAAGVPLKSVLLAAHLKVLSVLSNQQDVVTGLVSNGRLEESDGERVLGLFLNTLPFRLNLAGGTWIELVQETFKAEREFLPFRRYPLIELQKILGGQSLFEAAFNFVHFHVYQNILGLAGLEELDRKTFQKTNFTFQANFGLDVVSSQVKLLLEYETSELCEEQVRTIGSYYTKTLAAMATQHSERYESYSLLSVSERHQLLVEWNDTQVDYPQDKCIHQLVEEQVEQTPDAIALVFADQQLTYRELNTRANQLAHHLQAIGVEPGVLVGLCVERSVEMVIGLLGILKAGAAYMPLDPEYPTERLSFILEDTQARVLLTQQSLLDRLPQHQVQLICLDTDAKVISQCSQDNLISSVQTNNLAYIIYTSGSTGQPKGIAMNQLALCNLILWHRENLKIACGAKTLQFASISFDVSFQEIFTTWCSGGTLFLIEEELRRDTSNLLGFLQEKAIERMFLPFVALQQLAEVAVSNELVNSHLREIITAGEQLQITPAISEWFSKLTDCTLQNQYGPSESHLATSFILNNSVETWPLLPPIGRPIANTQIYILDRFLQPVPIGVPGEVYIAGVLLAQGYFNQRELTQEKFIPNPFEKAGGRRQEAGGRRQEAGGSKLYKTGDLARYLPDGNIESLGRIDNQVKIRGFRIELGEVEAVLSQHVDVQASCVIAREDIPGNKRLVAYIVPQKEQTLTVSVLRSFLKSKLPEYMVPSAIVILEALPLTPNGKLDRRALRAPDLHSQLSDKYVAPRNPIEEILSVIWEQVLKVEQVGIHNNFFELGGHSLLATQLISRVRTSLKVELPLRNLFAAPTIAQLSQNIQRLQHQDLELSTQPILPRTRDAELPLSFGQTRLWFLDQLNPNSSSYNLLIALRLVGTLDQTALEQSLQEIIARHEALHTNFITVDGKPSQIIHNRSGLGTVSIVDLRHLSTLVLSDSCRAEPRQAEVTEQEIALQQLAQQQAQRPFDLAKQALVRATLVVLSQTEHVLLVCIHHIVFDGWSMGVFVQELAALYNAYSQGQSPSLAPLLIQYADFAIWQRQWLQGDVLQNQLSYWQQQLKDAPALLSLPTDRPRPAVQTYNGAYQEFALSQKLTGDLTQLSQQQGVTLFMTLLATYDTLLYRYTGTEDILVGSPIANRDRSEIEWLIGFFVNTLVMRTNLAGNPSFSELLTRVREVTLSAYAHQNLPFEMLVEALQPERDLCHTPLFQVMFVFQNAPTSQVELTKLTVSTLPIKGTTSRFDLTLIMQNTATGLVGVWEYNTDLFDASTIERMTGHFVTLLSGIIANPQERISQLPLLTAGEQQQLLVEWNDTQTDYPCDQCIHQLFEEQVDRTPDAMAVVFEDQQLTYYQLNCRANQLADYLRSLGVKPDVLVGICVERSLDMVVGLLGILKAGGAYVPLDPEYPTERLSFMLEDAQVSVLLTQQRLIDRLPEYQVKQVCLDEIWEQIAQNDRDNPITGVKAFHLANVIYTSGSTGRPKGVMVEHKGLCNLAQAQIQTFGLTSDSRILQFASLSFDASIWEVVMALRSGGTLYLGTKDSLLPGKPLIERLRDYSITHITLPPSALAVMPVEELPALQTIIVAGEACAAELIRQWSVGRNFFNAYGPTEATVCATIAKCTEDDEKISIGKAIANVQTYILDENLQPVPVGVPGELHIGGIGLARGYLNRPELTQERFISNPFQRGRGQGAGGRGKIENQFSNCDRQACTNYSRLYKTGDLARYLPDSNIEYLGRIDNQLKIRGFRIELGEIEVVLAQHPEVKEVVVIVREDQLANKHLVAYIVPHGKQLLVSELRRFLKQQMPDYMIPSAFMLLETLPLTPNGKVDQKALPIPDIAISQEVSFVAARDTIELQLTQIWEDVLSTHPIGVQHNFFDLGGHSLLAVRLMARIQQQFGKTLPLATLFKSPTIEQLASILRSSIDYRSSSPLVTIQPVGKRSPFFCIHPGGGHVLCYMDLARYLGREQPFYGLQSLGLNGEQEPLSRIEDMAACYIQALQSVQPQGPYHLGGWSLGGIIAFEMAQQLYASGHQVALLALIDSYVPIAMNKPKEINEAMLLVSLAKYLDGLFGQKLSVSSDKLQQLEPEEQLNYILEQAKMLNILSPDFGLQQMRQLFKVFRANLKALYSYIPQPYPNRITLLCASEQVAAVSHDWSKLAAGGVEIHNIPGNHYAIVRKPNVQFLAERLGIYLDRVGDKP
ncbi:non-ribosomal peptide synthetase [Nostoc sp. 'Peltigera membranacea cyanobiont' 210A]|uniref:non-ribosomal peptide synthetase n=1 Tax=Nostoc sp. 'Peltigera membranacea cyanobiont' 210A TaxID=2014529 RepID=UPI000B956035|nr:non-ribosomal peptide synthetase [Nostoc sp. 'Peltigera membranacea cyanobiont' 210A]OYD96428.1 non-ribosomal peptide synthetase [Nostoc sp. 'Peltigera membranacea cyanobiont' 210A]